MGDPSDWKLVWSDEFNSRAGTAPNSSVWGREVGDGTVNGIPGWGNSELEYYTDGTNNVATDGLGNLQITAKEADGSLMCYYGPCEYTSARLLTKNRFEVAYGRIEARIKVPEGAGLWPAFWMLGTDIDQVNWPQTGEIDIMEFVGRGPMKCSGPCMVRDTQVGKATEIHTMWVSRLEMSTMSFRSSGSRIGSSGTSMAFSISQRPPMILFLQGKQWVFNHPFFILMNVAVGGNFGGPVGADTTFPQSMSVDYVRLYQTRPKPVSFNTSFRDDFTGWKQISIPFSAFQNVDGHVLDLSSIQTLRFSIPDGLSNPVLIDQIRLSAPCDVTVTNTADDGAGSLRRALASVCVGGTVTFSDALAGQTITLLSGPLTLGKNVTIDGFCRTRFDAQWQ